MKLKKCLEEIENGKLDKRKLLKKLLSLTKQKQQNLGLKILTANQILSRLPITLAQLKAGNNSEKFKNEIRELLYSLYRSKKLTKQLYKTFDWHYLKMKTVFMNTENSKTSESHIFKLDLTDKLNLKNPKKNMALANLSIYYTWKNIKSKYS